MNNATSVTCSILLACSTEKKTSESSPSPSRKLPPFGPPPPPPPPPSPRNYRCPSRGTKHFLLFTLQGNETTNGGANNHLCADNIQIPTGSSKTYGCRPKAYGRYLYIRIPGSNKILTLCEVEVYSLSKSVNLSSCLFCRYAWCLCVYLLYLCFFAFY